MTSPRKTRPGKAGRRAPTTPAQKRTFAYSALSVSVALTLAGFAGLHLFAVSEPTQPRVTTQSPAPHELVPQPARKTSEPVAIVPLSAEAPRISPTESAGAREKPFVEDEHPNEVDFDLNAIAAVLSYLNIDEDGQLVKDENLRQALRTAFLNSPEPMTIAELEDLKALVRSGLGGKAGNQAADIAERYYHYSYAFREVSSTFKRQGEVSSVQSNFKQLTIMRRAHLGDDLANALFGEEEAQMRYTLESMRIQSDDTLSAAEKKAQQEALKSSAPETFVSKTDPEKPAPESTL